MLNGIDYLIVLLYFAQRLHNPPASSRLAKRLRFRADAPSSLRLIGHPPVCRGPLTPTTSLRKNGYSFVRGGFCLDKWRLNKCSAASLLLRPAHGSRG